MNKNTRTGSSTAKPSASKKKVPATPARTTAKKSAAKKITSTLKKVVKTAKTAARKAVKAVKAVSKATSPSAKSAAKQAGKAVKSVKTTLAKTVSKATKTSAKKTAKSATKKVAKSTAKNTTKGTTKTTATSLVKRVASGAKKAVKTVAKKRPVVKARRPKTFSGREAVLPFGFPEATPELPESYGEDRLVLMTKDPEYLFAYWEITPESLKAGEAVKHRSEKYREALRLNWTARDIFDANYLLMPVSLAARKWYLRVPWSGLAYQVEIGWLGSRGHFIALLTSNPSDAPESWHATRRRLAAAGVSQDGPLGRALAGGQPQGSSEQAPSASSSSAAKSAESLWNFEGPDSLSSSFGSSRAPQRVVATSRPAPAGRKPSKPRKG